MKWLKGLLITAILLVPCLAQAYSPIARANVVPNQRIETNSRFKFGVVAFNKGGITQVSCAVAGQGYDGPTPLTSSTMELNERTDTYEYVVSIDNTDSNDYFKTEGIANITCTITGPGADPRVLAAVPLYIAGNGAYVPVTAYVDGTGGNDSTGEVGNQSLPYLTTQAAAIDAQTANGGSSDGNILYHENGTYSIANLNVSTTNQWLTITKAPGATKSNVIINEGTPTVGLLRINDITVQSQGTTQYVFESGSPTTLWADNVNVVGSGRWVASSNPIKTDTDQYSTDSYYTDMTSVIRTSPLARNITIESIGNDAFENTYLIINATVSDIDPGSTERHADAYQAHTTGEAPADNRIIYGYYGTDLHYQGLFMRATSGQATDNAFVNVFMEMREPGRDGGSGVVLNSAGIYGAWDHLIMWHCSFPYTNLETGDEASGSYFTNSSIIGNNFYGWNDNYTGRAIGVDPDYTLPANTEGNTFENNHYRFSNVIADRATACIPGPAPNGCDFYDVSPDSDADVSQSLADPGVESNANPVPTSGSVLIDRLSSQLIPADVLGNLRDSSPDVGAFEFQEAAPAPDPPTASAGKTIIINRFILDI
jgi:hypothetical protein